MAISEGRLPAGTVVQVPFPYTDAETKQHRPALVVATAGDGAEPFLLWVVMITSAAHRRWPDDVSIADPAGAGLPAPSVVRTAKITTIDRSRARSLGRIDPAALAETITLIGQRLGLRTEPGTLPARP
jgi:mRNA interferase MazF